MERSLRPRLAIQAVDENRHIPAITFIEVHRSAISRSGCGALRFIHPRSVRPSSENARAHVA